MAGAQAEAAKASREVALAVLRQAALDAVGLCCGLETSANDPSKERMRQRAIAEARAFWAAETGDWARSRAIWCDLAGVDPGDMRARALRRMAAAKEELAALAAVPRLPRRTPAQMAEMRAEVARLRAAGRSWREVGIELGIPASTAFHVMQSRAKA